MGSGAGENEDMKRKQTDNKPEVDDKVVSIEVVSDADLATVAGGRTWGWWEIQPTNASYGGGYGGGGYGGGGWGGGYGGGGYGGGWGGGGGYGGGWY
jgi:hypothetical protein